MLFDFLDKNKREEEEKSENTNSETGDDTGHYDISSLTSSLYKQNADIASKNKTLSISKKLYDISILALGTKELAQRIVQVIREELDVELVGILLYNAEKKVFQPLSFTSSERLTSVQSELKLDFNALEISPEEEELIKEVTEKKVSLNDDDLSSIWGSAISRKQYRELSSVGHIKTSIVSPLLIENETMGLAIFSINRTYENLSDHEIETIRNFSTIMAIAIDRALLYEKLTLTNKQLGEANDRLRELDQQKSEFVSLASHQIRGPLTAIKGYVSLILEGDYGEIPKDIKDALQKVASSTNSLAVLVGDYLDISRIELGHMKYDSSVFPMNDLVQEIIDESKPSVEKSGLEFEVDIESTPINVKADRNKIKQVLLNIIDNSIKYTPRGKISVSLKREGKNAVFRSQDTGLGIPKDVLPKLFQRFSRAPNAKESKILGTGLGLYLARKILEEHHGVIRAESEGEGKGSVFTVELKAE